MRVMWLTATALVLLPGCNTLDIRPEPTPVVSEIAEPPQQDWSEYAPDELPSTDWIADFNDPVLSQLVTEALEANTSIRSAGALYEAARARLDISEADRLPTVTGGFTASNRQLGLDLFGDQGDGDFGDLSSTALSPSVSANWEPDLWGRLKDQVNSSELDVTAAQADYAGARLAVTSRVAQNWFDLIEARLLLELSQRDVETQKRALRLTQRRFESGVAGSSDVRLARSSVAGAEATEASRKQRVAALARGLEILMRRYPADALDAAADLPPLPNFTGAGLPAQMLTRRPDLLAAERRLKSSGLSVDIARKALLPRLSLSSSLTSGQNSLERLFDLKSLVASLASNLTQPIFNGGSLKANVRQQEAFLLRESEVYADAVLQAYLEVENALDAEQRLAERESALRVALEEAQQAEARLERRYAEGLATILQLLDAQSRRISSESQLISARKERLANRVRLHVALGGGIYGDENIGL